jgi:hypothetical protein
MLCCDHSAMLANWKRDYNSVSWLPHSLQAAVQRCRNRRQPRLQRVPAAATVSSRHCCGQAQARQHLSAALLGVCQLPGAGGNVLGGDTYRLHVQAVKGAGRSCYSYC